MKCELKVSINMKLQYGKNLKLTEVRYIPQLGKNLLSVSRLVSKGATMGDIQDKTTINKKGVSMILYPRKGQNKSMMLYLKAKRYAPE